MELNKEVGTNELSELFMVSVRQVQRLTVAGTLVPINDQKPYRYRLDLACQDYFRYLESKVAERKMRERIENISLDKLRADVKYKEARAAKAKIELECLEEQYLDSGAVEAITNDSLIYLRELLQQMPENLGSRLAGTHTAAETAEIVKKEIYRILNLMADYQFDEETYKQRLAKQTD